VQLLGSFGVMSLQLRKAVLIWLLTVFDALNSTTRLHKLYSVRPAVRHPQLCPDPASHNAASGNTGFFPLHRL